MSLLGLVHTLGNLLTNMSLGAVAVSFTHTIKVTFGGYMLSAQHTQWITRVCAWLCLCLCIASGTRARCVRIDVRLPLAALLTQATVFSQAVCCCHAM